MKRTTSWRWAAVLSPFLALAASAAAAVPGQQAGRLTTTPAIQGSIAFGGGAIYRRYPDGRFTQLTQGTSDLFPAWSADGTRIAFERANFPDADCALFVMNDDGSGLHQVGQITTDCSGASWGPDDRQLAFGEAALQGLNGAALSIVNADGSGLRRIFRGPGANFEGVHPTWSPDGRTIVFGWTAGRRSGLLAIHPDGSGIRTLITPARAERGHVAIRSRGGRRQLLVRDYVEPSWGPAGT